MVKEDCVFMSVLDKLKNLFKKDKLDAEQKLIDELYTRDGLADEVLDRQVALNMKRNELDIPDKNELNDDGWSQ